MTFVAANRLDYGFRTVQYLQKRTKRLEIPKTTGFSFSLQKTGRIEKDITMKTLLITIFIRLLRTSGHVGSPRKRMVAKVIYDLTLLY